MEEMPTGGQPAAIEQFAHANHAVLVWSCLAGCEDFVEAVDQPIVGSISLN